MMLFGILFAAIWGILLITSVTATLEKYSLSWGLGLIFILATIWILASGKYWWLFFPLMAFWGGLFWIGFKIYPDEIGLIVVTMALAVALIRNYSGIERTRPGSQWNFILLILYLLIHMSVSMSMGTFDWLSGSGSIVRVYASALTYLLFSWMYYKYGTSEQIKAAIYLIFTMILVRIILSLLTLYMPTLVNISEYDFLWLYSSVDLRYSALHEILFTIILFYLAKKSWMKSMLIIFIAALFIILLLGEGRVSVANGVLIFIMWVLLAKRTRYLLYLLPLLAVCIVLVFSEMHILANLPPEMQRALSFIPGLESQFVYNTEISNDWHFDLMRLGFQRWSDSFISLIVGNTIDTSGVQQFLKLNYFAQVEIAASTARYECTLWTILATCGIMGMLLYIWIFKFLFSEIIPEVIKKGIISFNYAVYAVAIMYVTQMIVFAWIRGGFPGVELMLGVFAKALYDDSKKNDRSLNAELNSVQ